MVVQLLHFIIIFFFFFINTQSQVQILTRNHSPRKTPNPKTLPKPKPNPNILPNFSSPSHFSSSFTSSTCSPINSFHRKSNYFSRKPPPPRKSLQSRQSTADEFQKSLQPIITEIPKRRSKSILSPRGGVKLRSNTPRVRRRRGKGVAVVKCSRDPRRDFRDSMVEMIVENNLKEKKDLEELLACYLTLNSEEYHDLIIHVFKQLWFDFVATK